MIELVIFDCDGVLVDSEPLSIAVDAKVLATLGWPLSEQEVIERFVGVSQQQFVSEIEAHIGRSLGQDWKTEFEPLYRRAFEEHLQPVKGIVDALGAGGRRPASGAM